MEHFLIRNSLKTTTTTTMTTTTATAKSTVWLIYISLEILDSNYDQYSKVHSTQAQS